jgi:bifunctional non-homologous end joining protein LigD
LYVDHVVGAGEELLRTVQAAGLPGIVAKHAESGYEGGATKDWLVIDAPASVTADRGSATSESLETVLARRKQEHAAAPSRVPFSNLEKTYWPRQGYTKGDLIAYYEQVADVLLPYLEGRPVHMLRYPDGVEGKAFYQRQAPEYLPDWIRTELIAGDEGEEPDHHFICDSRDALLYLVNLGSIDLHPWMSRLGALDHPDWVVLDLDPKGASFANVVRVAKLLGKILRGVGIKPLLKTSGKTGMHVFVPLNGVYEYGPARMFCESVARLAVRQLGDIATVERSVGQRGGKVYVDFLQNFRGQTVVPPYVVRPTAAASVSMPLLWDELEGELAPEMFTMRAAVERLDKYGDLFRGVLTEGVELGEVLVKLEEYVRGMKG